MQEQKTKIIELKANATTDYTWVCTISPPEGVLRKVSENGKRANLRQRL